jgi:2-amino-4-hydroxy-6-hydroxymethyldihydropteridine diphosphokinase
VNPVVDVRIGYIALGANLSDPVIQVENALARLRDDNDGVRLLARSQLYRSAPIGPAGQDDYCNAVCSVETTLTAMELLARLQRIEQLAGRTRDGPRWGPRVLDLDLLHVVDERSDSSELQLPHPHLHERNFVLVPLAEIAPALVIEPWGSVSQLAAASGWNGLSLWH